MLTPEYIASPNTPTIDDENLQLILKKTDLCLSSNNTLASEETPQEYTEINNNHGNNTSFNSIPGAMEPLQQSLSNSHALISPIIANISHRTHNDERTIFVENVLLLFKYFGNTTNAISFRW
ncbi:hypothetical protein BCV72DRAFT_307660 [Rhizopus microsporus var. microsporus]|uniref:Uncharacterized protein n=1 Tax=Rhizopus microsporus var. microsporus TaxID=86635 RepID=A0A1X0QWD5_RHIZD|nr:hypothetical protein BCV72DRAFT_307660 [Rhizopus microsporus var. microsporus]